MISSDRTDSTWKYIVAWLLTGLLARIFGYVIGFSLSNGNSSSFSALLIWAGIGTGVALLAALIISYSIFRSLYISRVIPWIVVLGGLGFAFELSQVARDFDRFGLAQPIEFYLFSSLSGITAVILFYLLFSKMGRLRPSPASAA